MQHTHTLTSPIQDCFTQKHPDYFGNSLFSTRCGGAFGSMVKVQRWFVCLTGATLGDKGCFDLICKPKDSHSLDGSSKNRVKRKGKGLVVVPRPETW